MVTARKTPEPSAPEPEPPAEPAPAGDDKEFDSKLRSKLAELFGSGELVVHDPADTPKEQPATLREIEAMMEAKMRRATEELARKDPPTPEPTTSSPAPETPPRKVRRIESLLWGQK